MMSIPFARLTRSADTTPPEIARTGQEPSAIALLTPGVSQCRTAGPWKLGDANGLEAVGVLIGRAKEAYALECVLAEIRAGLSGILVLRGEAGIGKTALLDWAVGQADDMQVPG